MTNKIVELNQKEIATIAGGEGKINSIFESITEGTKSIIDGTKGIAESITEDSWRYVIEPAITIGCFLFVAVVAYEKAKPAPKKLKTH